ncbi:hypothetical protein Syun_018440 [Stephania yunnanensis]|uniref:Fe2OG dioxygenase domain-containing protein n=1 Tax=Stephania yunnanensis TaxID=152371 RepID=A0AAP0IS83_9MAGN
MGDAVLLPIIDLSAEDRLSTVKRIRQACMEYGFFYLVNHGIEEELFKRVFDESKKFFTLPLQEKMKVKRNNYRGYTEMYDEKLDPSVKSKGDLKESFYVGPSEDAKNSNLNQWPSEALVTRLIDHLGPSLMDNFDLGFSSNLQWKRSAGKRLLSLVALALDLEEDFFEKVGAYPPMGFLRLLHYPGESTALNDEIYGASSHSDYGMITLLATDGIPGLQACICQKKDSHPQVWEDVPHVKGAFIINVGDMTERWTNCLFRSTLHRVIATGQERYSVAFFLEPKSDCVVECLKTCCSETSPPRFPPIRSGDYLEERYRLTYASLKI